MTSSIQYTRSSSRAVARIAAARGYVQSRGVGTGVTGSVSQLIDAIGAGECVVIRPIGSWRPIMTALNHARIEVSRDADAAVIAALRDQIEAIADFASDDAE